MSDEQKNQGLSSKNSVSSHTEQKQKARHNFDGIEENDNDMPKWWVNLFIVTIIFSAIYFAWYHLPFFPSKDQAASYEEAVLAEKDRLAVTASKSETSFDYEAALKDAAFVARGKEAYVTTCAACHAMDGGGGVGPNLTDKYWIHGASFAAIEATIANGVSDKGMPAWGPVLGNTKVREISVFVKSLAGTKPAVAKEAQGTEE